jgi:hypothetical protein
MILLKRRGAKLREEVWKTPDGETVRYNLAYTNTRVCRLDNGRVLGYDKSHGYDHRHFMGNVEPFEFDTYEGLARRFYAEVQELWRREDEDHS